MATQKEIEATYDYMDDIFRLSLGEHGDITCAMYNGDYSMTLEQAQKKKHDFILDSLRIKPGDRVLDIGCGWGPVLNAVRLRGSVGVGVTLSPAQAAADRANGLNVVVKDWKELDPGLLGRFDAIVSVGAFEHFCSIDELNAGKQEEIYRAFFKLCSDVLKPTGRLFLQTMMWGKRVPDPTKFDVNAPKLSDQWVMGHLEKFYPGSWLPNGLEQIERCASPYFKLISENNGRLDYIQTMKEWSAKASAFSLKKLLFAVKLSFRFFNKTFRQQITSLFYSCNRICFEREIMSHQRMVFEKK